MMHGRLLCRKSNLGLDIAGAANDNTPPDLPLAVVADVNTTPVLLHVHADHLGRPIRMTDGTKTTVWQASWKPWGEAQSISGSHSLNQRFPGQYFQIETGLHFNWHRHYDPVTGRYTQPDPLRFVDGPSVYAYAGNSPYIYTDRDGLNSIAIPIPGSGLVRPGTPYFGPGLRPPLPIAPPYIESLPNSLPRTGQCKASEWQQCEAKCGSRAVLGCYVSIGWQIKGVSGKGPIRRERRTVNCN